MALAMGSRIAAVAATQSESVERAILKPCLLNIRSWRLRGK